MCRGSPPLCAITRRKQMQQNGAPTRLHLLLMGSECEANIKVDIAALGPTELLQFLPQRRDHSLCRRIGLGIPHQHTDPPHPLGLLRARRKRPCSRAAEQRDELAPLQSIGWHPLAQPTPGTNAEGATSATALATAATAIQGDATLRNAFAAVAAGPRGRNTDDEGEGRRQDSREQEGLHGHSPVCVRMA